MNGQQGSGESIVISNEFAAVVVRKVATRNGERLEIRSISHDQAIQLDAIALEALTWSTPLEVGRGLETPLGPDPSELAPTFPSRPEEDS